MKTLTSRTTTKLFNSSIIEEQLVLENQSVTEGVARYRRLAADAVERGAGASLKSAERLIIHWFTAMTEAIKEEQEVCKNRNPGGIGRIVYGPVIHCLDAERLAYITMSEAVSWCMRDTHGVGVRKLAYAIGREITAQINIDNFKSDKVGRKSLRELTNMFRRVSATRLNWWAKKTLDNPLEERRACTHLGVAMLWLLLGVASCAGYEDDFVLAFRHYTVREKIHRTKSYFCFTDEAYEIIADGDDIRSLLRPKYIPMVMKPVQWTDKEEGGYLRIHTPFISKPTSHQKAALNEADLTQVHNGLNAINSTPWRVNLPMLSIMRQLWQEGGGELGLPRLSEPQHPPYPEDGTAQDIFTWRESWGRKAVVQRKSDRTWFHHVFRVAEQFTDRQAIFFPHQFDFRGRVNPIPLYLNHHGPDPCRGLLMFARGLEPGKDGDRAIKIHTANCYGLDKVSYDDRVAWVDGNMSNIERSVEDPLDDGWWRGADKPWQFLAACMAMNDPHLSQHLPVHADGTCNGLQHYAALGRDSKGAAVVNMVPGDKPSDIYTDIADLSKSIAEKDADEGYELAIAVVDMIDRKVVKQPVMTKTYNVSMVGARDQIWAKLKDAGMIDNSLRYRCAKYLANIVMESTANVCPAAEHIMTWIKDICRKVVKNKYPLTWITPTGLPVVQPYRLLRKAQLRTILQEVILPDRREKAPPAPGKQVNGCSPNYIHSIDSAHMLMTGQACYDKAITLAAVHDSYWTNAATMGQMNQILREQFVELHSRPLLQDFLDHQKKLYPGQNFPYPPPQGDYDIKDVLHSDYFFN